MALLREPASATAGAAAGRRLGAPPPDGVSALDTAPFGWAPLAILMAVGIVDAMESRIIAGALPHIQRDFQIGDAAAGAIPTAVTIAGVIVILPAGYLADRYHRTNLMALVVLSWAFLLFGSAVAISFAMFFAVRVVLGAADSIDNPASGSLLADYYPPVTRGKVFGWARLTTYAGGALGGILGGVMAATVGWRWAYALMIIPGLLCAWLLWRLREPPRGFIDRLVATAPEERLSVPPSPDDEPAGIGERLGELARAIGRGTMRLMWRGETKAEAGPSTEAERAGQRLAAQLDFKEQLKYIARVPTLRFVTLGLAAMSFGLGGIIFWVPTLIYRSFGVDTDVAATVSSAVTLAGLVAGTMFGAWLGRRWHGVREGGRLLAGGGGLFIGSLLLAATIGQPTLLGFALVLLVATTFLAMAIPNLMASVADVLVATSRGIGFSMLQFLVAGAAAWSPLAVGAISEATDSLLIGMYALVLPGTLGGLLVLAARKHFDRDAGLVLDAARRSAPQG